MTTVTLPIYIQKQIIKIFCNEINNKNRQFRNYLTPQKTYKENETNLMSISLVCNCWFTFISNNITVLNDFQCCAGAIYKSKYCVSIVWKDHFLYKRIQQQQLQQQSKYRLLKYENINEITLNISEWGINYEQLGPLINLINKVICEKFINLDKLYVSSDVRLQFSSSFNFKKLVFRDWCINFLKGLQANIRDVEHLVICLTRIDFSQDQINDLFKHLQSVSYLSVPIINETKSTFTYKSIYESLNVQQDGGNSSVNCLSNLKIFRDCDLNIDDMYYVCKLSPNLSRISFGTCIDNLLYQIGIEDDEFTIITPCICSTKECNQNSREYWHYVLKYISQSKHLNHFILEHRCGEKLIPEVMDGEDDNEFDYLVMLNENLSNKFMNQIISTISTNNHLNILEFNNEIPNKKQLKDKVKAIKPNLTFLFDNKY